MSRFDDLERLWTMLDEGKITSEEYAQLKAELLAEPSPKPGPLGPFDSMEGMSPGWYSDARGKSSRVAYWDGSRWVRANTNHLVPS